MKTKVPKSVSQVTKTLKDAGFEAFLVGGCVRDLIIGREPKDWDVTTNAVPEQIIALFPKTFYENTFGTVGVVNEAEGIPEKEKVIEVTPYRLESDYTDGRHPDAVAFSSSLIDDLQRRDFTINAIAYDVETGEFVDPYKGQSDIASRTLRAVGKAETRFQEDGLRVLRAIRIATELGFTIESDTEKAIQSESSILGKIAAERIRDEFNKLIMSDNPMVGVIMLQKLDILKYIVPELEEGLHMKQTQAHSYGVFEHLVRSMQHAADKGWPLEIRLAALLHDIGKPKTKRVSPETGDATFYGHEVVGARMAEKILERLRYPKKTIELIVKLVRWHMFFSDTEQISLSAVRRMVANVGIDNIWKLMDVRVCDRIGTGRPKENPYRLRKYQAMIEQVTRDPISVGMLKIDGNDLVKELGVKPGPIIGFTLNALLEEVFEDPDKNTKESLLIMAKELIKLPEAELKAKAEAGKVTRERLETEEIKDIEKKYKI